MISIPEEMASQHLRESFSKGDVLFWRGFPGLERKRNSYFVLLTNCINDQFIVARATRQIEHYSGATAKRLEHDIIFIKKNETTIFPEDTIIDLTWIEKFTIENLSKLLGSDISRKGTLPTDVIQRINDAVRMAVTISERDRKLILKTSKT